MRDDEAVFLLLIIVILSYATGYSVCIGLVFILQKLVNFTFQTNFDFNIFGLGAILYIVFLLFNKN